MNLMVKNARIVRDCMTEILNKIDDKFLFTYYCWEFREVQAFGKFGVFGGSSCTRVW